MKKRLALITAVMLMACGIAACGSSEEATEEGTEESGSVEAEVKSGDKDAYGIGDEWTVEGQWTVVIDSVSTTDERNEFDDSDPAQVLIIDYHYENLGYKDQNEIMDGLYISLDEGTLVDEGGNVCTSYPADVEYAQETPVGAKCSAQAAFGLVDESTSATLTYSQYDGTGAEQKVEFDLTF